MYFNILTTYLTNLLFLNSKRITFLCLLLSTFGILHSQLALAEKLQEKDISHKLSISSYAGLNSSMALIADKKHKINGARALFSIDGDFLTFEFDKKASKKGSNFQKYVLNFPTPDFKSKKRSTYRIQVSYGDSEIYLSKTYRLKASCQKSGLEKVTKKVKKGSLKYNMLKDIHKMQSSALFLKQLNSKLTKLEGKI